MMLQATSATQLLKKQVVGATYDKTSHVTVDVKIMVKDNLYLTVTGTTT